MEAVKQFHSSFEAKARGGSILTKLPSVQHCLISWSLRFVAGKLYNLQVALVNVYAPNSDDPKFFEDLFSSLLNPGTYSLILGSDLNCWLDAVLDRSSLKPTSLSKSALQICSFLSTFGVTDIW